MENRFTPFEDQFIRDLRSADGLERRNGRRSFIDIDLAQPSKHLRVPRSSLTNRGQVLVSFENLARRADRSTQEGEYAYRVLMSGIAYFQTLEGLKMPFEERLLKMDGIYPMAPDQLLTEIANQKTVVSDHSLALGYPYTKEGYSRFVRQEKLTRAGIMEEFHETEEWFLPLLKEKLELSKDYNFGYQTKFEPVKDYWFNWVSAVRTGNQIQMLFRLNTHQDHQRGLVRGNAQRLAPHEIGGHVAQATLWKEAIRSGLLSPTSGIITIPSPAEDNLEGLASTLVKWLPESQQHMSPFGTFAVERAYLSELVMGYVDQVINTTEKGDDELRDEMRRFWEDHCPSDELAKIDRSIGRFMRSIWHQMYLYTYGASNYTYRKMVEALTQPQRDKLLKQFYQIPMTPSQVSDRFTQMRLQNHQAA